jgi:hypothetical protein
MPPSRLMSALSVGLSTTMAVGRSWPRMALRASKVKATLGAVAIAAPTSLVTFSPLSTRRIGWLMPLHSA